MKRLLPLWLLVGCTFSPDTGGLEGRPCASDGACLEGYFCNLSTNTCEISVCDGGAVGTLENCGACGDDCVSRVANANPVCLQRGGGFLCSYEGGCAAGSVDLNGEPSDGCECEVEPEIACDGIDQDCDGADDVQAVSVENCGSCGNDCSALVSGAANPLCVADLCNYDACETGAVDTDGDRRNGCECRLSNGGIERCDGIDNNCNGLVDDGLLGCQCSEGAASQEVCDGIDNDCNGIVDDGPGFDCVFGDIELCDGGSGVRNCTGLCVFGGCIPRDDTPPAVVDDFTATGGDGIVTLAWTYPSDSDLGQCIIRRALGTAPPASETADEEVAVIASVTPGAGATLDDPAVVNDTTYTYRVFCRDNSGNFSGASGAENTATVTPLDALPPQVGNFIATSGTSQTVPYLFTVPSGVDECVVLRRTGQFPTGHDDGVAILVASFSAPGLTDDLDEGLVNDQEYFYAVFCRNGSRWNDALTEGDNAARATPSDLPSCEPTDTMKVAEHSLNPCGAAWAGGEPVVVFQLAFETDCTNDLETLTLETHPAVKLADDTFAELSLVRDLDGDGLAEPSDRVVDSGTLSGGSLTFSGFRDRVEVGVAANFLVVATPADSVLGPVFAAFRIPDEESISLTSASQIVSFDGGAPIDSRMITVTPSERVCASGPADLGAGSFGAASAALFTATGGGNWNGGAGDESTFTAGPTGAAGLSDCNVSEPDYLVSDEGTSSRVLRLGTPMPVGLPVAGCTLELRLYATDYSGGGNCDYETLPGMKEMRLFSYDGASTVVATPLRVNIESAPSGPAASASCESHYIDVDLTEVYAAAQTSSYSVRVVLEEGQSENGNSNKLTRVTEAFFRFRSP